MRSWFFLLGIFVSALVSACPGNQGEVQKYPLPKALSETSGGGTNLYNQQLARQEVYQALYASSVELYTLLNAQLPASWREAEKYSFILLPEDYFIQWEKKGNTLLVTRRLRLAGEDGNVFERTFTRTHYLPGTPEEEEWRKGRIQSKIDEMRKLRQIEGSHIPYTEQDIREGRVPLNLLERLRYFSRNEKELAQLLWAIRLAGFLSQTAGWFYRDNGGVYPETIDELVGYIGELNFEALIAPINGKRLGFVTEWDGENVVYNVTPDRKGYEVMVPLFGAGTEKPLEDNPFVWLSAEHDGYFAGRYFKASVGKGKDVKIPLA